MEFTDEKILEYEAAIKQEHAERMPLVGDREAVSVLEQEYEGGSPVMLNKIKNLQGVDALRRCRGDGNCFYRAFAYGWFEQLRRRKDGEYQQALQWLQSTPTLLESVEFSSLAYEDFYTVTLNVLTLLPTLEPAALLQLFQDAEHSNSVVVYFRFVLSAFLQTHPDDYAFFIEDGLDLGMFCRERVEAFGREAEAVCVSALAACTSSAIHVTYLDNTPTETANVLDFGEGQVHVHMLYRPGHYDLLYAAVGL